MSDRNDPFCHGSGLAPDGERACDACGGSGKWSDALLNVATDASRFLHNAGYAEAAVTRDLDVLLAVKQAGVDR